MFERFTDAARQVVVFAQEEARTLGHNYIGTEHILLGLLREPDGLAGEVLESLDITVQKVRTHVLGIIGSRPEVTRGAIPFVPRAQKVLELARREGLSLGSDYVGTEHILLALVSETGGVAVRILLDLDANPDKIRGSVMRMSAGPDRNVSGPADRSSSAERPWLDPRAQPPVWEGGIDLGWRGHSVLLATLGAAALTRSAFAFEQTGTREPLAMHVLARLLLQISSDPAGEPGEEAGLLRVGLAFDAGEFEDAIRFLVDAQWAVYPVGPDEDRVAITAAGVAKVQEWLVGVLALFAGWPPDHPGVDDAIG